MIDLLKNLGVDIPEENDSAVRWSLQVGQTQVVHLEILAEEEQLLVHSPLFPAIDGTTSAVCRKIMELNAYGKITNGQTISLSKEQKMFILSEKMDLKESSEKILHRFRRFLALLQFLKEKWPEWQASIVYEELIEERQKNNTGKLMIFK